jgi:hypothetical protein
MSPINRRNLLRLAGVATASAALAGAVRAEGFSILPKRPAMFATATPVFVQSITLRVRDPELMARFYTEIIGLTVLSRDDTNIRSPALPTIASARRSISMIPRAMASRSMPTGRPSCGRGTAIPSSWAANRSTSIACWR